MPANNANGANSSLDWIALALPVLISPLLLFPSPEWMWVALLVPLFWLCSYRVKGHFLEPNPLNSLLLPLSVMVLVSLYATFDVEFSLGKVAGTLLGIFVFSGIVQFVGSRRRLSAAVGIFCLGGLGLALISLIGTQWTTKFPGLGWVGGLLPGWLRGLPGAEEGFNPNAVGGSLILFLPLLLVLAVGTWRGRLPQPRKFKFLYCAALLSVLMLMFAIILISQSRGAWAGLLASGAILLSFRYPLFRWSALALIVAGVTAAAFQPAEFWNDWIPEGQVESGELSMAYRLEVWSRALYGIQDFAFTGMGMNAFRKVVPILYPLFTVFPDYDVASAHNHILQSALDLGVPGMVAYVAIWAAVARVLYFVRKGSGDPLMRALALGIGGGLLAYFLFQMVDAVPLGAKVGIFWWMAVAIAVAMFKVVLKEEKPQFGAGKVGAWEVLLMWVLFSLVAISFIGEYPYVGLAVGIGGGVIVGYYAVENYLANESRELHE